MDNFWWEDSSCLASEVQHNAVAAICQYDIAVASTTTTTSAASTTTTTVTTTTTTEVTTTTVTTTVTPGNSCPSGWQEFRGHCYLVIKNYVTWADAEKDCINKGGHLASIHSAAENSFIHKLESGEPLWIGGTDAAVEVGFIK
jgi:cell wall-associated NlpC family hydrolase